jgi:serine/threonine protein kinase
MKFTIYELLGQGGYGSVYRCALTKSDGLLTVGQEFAVKVINSRRIAMLMDVPVEIVVPRLLREAEVIHMLGEHPYIVRLHGVFSSEESHKIYFAYEYVRGGDLFGLLAKRRAPMEELDARRVIAQLAEAVHFGHQRGIAHRSRVAENSAGWVGQTRKLAGNALGLL